LFSYLHKIKCISLVYVMTRWDCCISLPTQDLTFQFRQTMYMPKMAGNFNWNRVYVTLKREGSSSCHTSCDTGPRSLLWPCLIEKSITTTRIWETYSNPAQFDWLVQFFWQNCSLDEESMKLSTRVLWRISFNISYGYLFKNTIWPPFSRWQKSDEFWTFNDIHVYWSFYSILDET
jgi:hypothetical protein